MQNKDVVLKPDRLVALEYMRQKLTICLFTSTDLQSSWSNSRCLGWAIAAERFSMQREIGNQEKVLTYDVNEIVFVLQAEEELPAAPESMSAPADTIVLCSFKVLTRGEDIDGFWLHDGQIDWFDLAWLRDLTPDDGEIRLEIQG